MSKQFYSFLADEIIKYFTKTPLVAGSKYNIQFETEEQVKDLYEILEHNTLATPYEYKDVNGNVKYKSYQLNFGNGISLIVSSTMEDVQPDFLTKLRNMVGVEEGYEEKAILFIHNTSLDSIMGGTESFSKEGMPFHVDLIQQRIKAELSGESFSRVDKKIIELDLERKKDGLFDDNGSVFEYREILDILNKGYIDKGQYKDFGIFYDNQLLNIEKEIDLARRIKKNAEEFNRIDQIHNYGDPETQLEKYYDEKGLNKLKSKDWKDLEYKNIEKYVEDSKNKAIIEYTGAFDWDKEEGTSKAKLRIRNILVFDEQGKEEVELEFPFSESIKNEHIQSVIGNVQATARGKKLKVILKNENHETSFYKITVKVDSIKFEFKIALINCNQKYLESVKSIYSLVVKKKDQYISLKTNENQLTFNEYAEAIETHQIDSNHERVKLNPNAKTIIKVSDEFDYDDDNNAKFNLDINSHVIPFVIEGTSEKAPPIEGFKVWKLKREKQSNFKLFSDNKLHHGTKEYFARDEFRKTLNLERELLTLGGIYFEEDNEGIEAIDLEVNDSVKKAFIKIVDYYKSDSKLPSLTYLNEDLKALYNSFLTVYLNVLSEIEEGSNINQKEINLFKLGVLKRKVGEKEVILTPLHPLNIAYQLHFNGGVDAEVINEDVLKRFTSTYLLPFIIDEEDKMYIPMEQTHSPEYKIYVDENLPRYKSSRDFVSKLVREKIEEFIGHFRYMFDLGHYAPIKINLINTGDSKEILQGIFKYYLNQLKSEAPESILPIDLYIYSNKSITNAFEEVALNDNLEALKKNFDLNLSNDTMSEEDVLNLYREKVRFYSKNVDSDIEYAHITFLEMNNEIKKANSKMENIPSGVILNGSISGVPSVFLGDAYRTGFGTKYANIETPLMQTAMKLNALNAATAGDGYYSEVTKTISIPSKNKLTLDKIYDSSHWVTFIDPKVDLNFFKNDPNAKDLLIIHYSDQYTTAGGYDAITVTRKSGPYQRVIEEFLQNQGVNRAHDVSPYVINMFNAVNGDWLLRLLSNKAHSAKEKISILAAIKIGLAKFKSENIIWVPISLEEILRVSGGAGLKQSEGFLSAKNLGIEGSKSDDLLFVGIEETSDDVLVHLYPVEVKAGQNKTKEIQKGMSQAKLTYEEFIKKFFPNEDGILTMEQKVYRNFLMQIVIMTAEKYNLYHISSEINWQRITDSELRKKLLNEEYVLSNEIEKHLKKAAVISFKDGAVNHSLHQDEDVFFYEILEKEGIALLTKDIEEIRALIGSIDISVTPTGTVNKPDQKEVEVKPYGTSNGFGSSVSAEEEKELPIAPTLQGDKVILSKNEDAKQVSLNENERHMEILFGQNQKNNQMIYWEPNDTNKVLHTNTGIIGTMGTGKTQFTKSVITQIYRESKYNVNQQDVGILIFDYKGDYNKTKEDFIEATNATVYELYQLPFNPLSVIKAKNSKPMLPLHTANSLKVTLAKAFGLGIKQETLLRDLIMEAYEAKGIIKNKPDTWDLPAPTLKDVYDLYINRDDLKEDSLYAAFSNLIDFEIFEPVATNTKSLFELLNGVTVIDLSGYDSDIQNLVVAITLDLFYSQMQAFGHSAIQGQMRQLNKMILVDEADNFLSKDFDTLKKILKEGREFGVGTILSTQLLSHFSTGENKYSDYILTWIVHNVAEISAKDVKYIFNAQSKADQEKIVSSIKSLSKHFSLVKMGDSEKPLFMKDKAFWELLQ